MQKKSRPPDTSMKTGSRYNHTTGYQAYDISITYIGTDIP